MGQVPKHGDIGIVGDGRAARHFTRYLKARGVAFKQWSRRLQAAGGNPPEECLAGCSTVFVLLSDAAIEPWLKRFHRPDARYAHFSGALVTELACGVHPLVSFGETWFEEAEYERIAFVGEAGRPSLHDLVPELRNPCFAIPARDRPLYHALCVMAGNFSVLLWQKLLVDLEARFGVPRAAADPYLESVTRQLKADPLKALTGPLARGDRETLAANLRSLEGDRWQAIYQAFVESLFGKWVPTAKGDPGPATSSGESEKILTARRGDVPVFSDSPSSSQLPSRFSRDETIFQTGSKMRERT